MGQPVEERGGQLLVAGEDGHPFGKREIGRDDRRPSLVAISDQIEKQLAAHAVERDKPELVDDQDVDAQQTLLDEALPPLGSDSGILKTFVQDIAFGLARAHDALDRHKADHEADRRQNATSRAQAADHAASGRTPARRHAQRKKKQRRPRNT